MSNTNIKGFSNNIKDFSNYVIFHHNDADGFRAACMVQKWMDAQQKNGSVLATWIPFNHGKDEGILLEACAGKNVFVLDFTPPSNILGEMIERAEAISILDHHRSAIETLLAVPIITEHLFHRDDRSLASANPRAGEPLNDSPTFSVLLDLEHSGCQIARTVLGLQPDWLTDYIEDRDLWLFKLPNSKEINAKVQSLPRWFEAYDELESEGPEIAYRDGVAILDYQKILVKRIAHKADLGVFHLYPTLFVNTPVLSSEVAGYLRDQGAPLVVTWHKTGTDDRVEVGLYSTEDGPDVSELAKLYGGGGHRGAAGFSIPIDVWISYLPRKSNGQ